jgi:hypothetical protein
MLSDKEIKSLITLLDDEDKLSSPKLIFKCGSDDLIMGTQIDLTKKVYNKQLLAVLKNQFCMKNSNKRMLNNQSLPGWLVKTYSFPLLSVLPKLK